MKSQAKLRNHFQAVLVMLVGLAAWTTPALAQDESGRHIWVGGDLGGAVVESQGSAPSSGRKVFAASFEVGYRITPQLGLGFEYGGVLPLGGCTDFGCGKSGADFAPNFTHMIAFGEFRPRDSRWRIRAGAGESGFCHSKHWSRSAWSWFDTARVVVFGDDYRGAYDGTGSYRCDSRMKAFGGTASVGYDWLEKVEQNGDRFSVGWRLSVEAANFDATPSIKLPAFRHRAVILTLHLSSNS